MPDPTTTQSNKRSRAIRINRQLCVRVERPEGPDEGFVTIRVHGPSYAYFTMDRNRAKELIAAINEVLESQGV